MGVIRFVIAIALLGAPGLLVLSWKRQDLCDEFAMICTRGGSATASILILAAAVLLLIIFGIAIKLLRPVLSAQIEQDRAPWADRLLLLCAVLGSAVLTFLVAAVLLAGTPPRGIADGNLDSDLGIEKVVIAASLLACAVVIGYNIRGRIYWRAHRKVLSSSPMTPGLRQFSGTVLGPGPGAPGARAPFTNVDCAAWAIECEETWSHYVNTKKDYKYDENADQVKTTVTETEKVRKGWTFLDGSEAPFAVQTTDGVVLIQTPELIVQALPAYEQYHDPRMHHEFYPGMNEQMKEFRATRFRVGVLPRGAEVKVSGKVQLDAAGQPWVRKMKVPTVPLRMPYRHVRKDSLRNVVVQKERVGEKLWH